MQNINEPSSLIISESSSQNAQESFFIVIRLLTSITGIVVLLTGLGFVIVSIKELFQAITSPETITPIISQWVAYFSSNLPVTNIEPLFPLEVIATFLLFCVGFFLAAISLRLMLTGARIVVHTSTGKAAIKKMIDESVQNHLRTMKRSHN
jgi:hypothetical protein